MDPQKVECEKDLARPEEKLDGPSYSLDISTCDMKNAISNVRTVPPATAQVPDVVKDATSTRPERLSDSGRFNGIFVL